MSRPWRAASFGVSGQAVQQAPAVGQRTGFRAERLLAPRADATNLEPHWRQALVGVVGAQAQAVLGARGEHAVGLGDAARHQVVDHHAHVAVGARDDEVAPAAPLAFSAALMPAAMPCAPASS